MIFEKVGRSIIAVLKSGNDVINFVSLYVPLGRILRNIKLENNYFKDKSQHPMKLLHLEFFSKVFCFQMRDGNHPMVSLIFLWVFLRRGLRSH